MRFSGLLLLALACGCAPSEQKYLPLTVGNRWSYSVKADFDTTVDDIAVTGRVPVGKVEGYRMTGNLGTSEMAWDGSTLLAAELAGQRFSPPLPLLTASTTMWKGHIETAGRRIPAKAKVVSTKVKERFANRDYDTRRTEITFSSVGPNIYLTTWFAEGIGILKQEQRTGAKRDRRIEYLSGP